MEFKVSASDLNLSLQRAKGITRNAGVPILAYLHVSAHGSSASFTSFDGEVGVVSEVPATVLKPGQGLLTIQAREFANTLRGEVTLSRSGRRSKPLIELTAGSTTAGFYEDLDSKDFPKLPESTGVMGPLNAARFLEMVRRVSHAMSSDGGRPYLCGAFLHQLESGKHRMVATDGTRMALLTRELGDFSIPADGIIIPLNGVVKLEKLLELHPGEDWECCTTPNFFSMRRPGLRFIARLVDAKFPEYKRIIPNSQDVVPVQRTALVESLKRVSIAAEGRDATVSLLFDGEGSLRMEAHSAQVGDAQDTISLGNSRTTQKQAHFNPKLLLEAITAMERDEVLVSVPGEKDPALLRTSEEDGFLAIVMPMRG